MCPEMGKGKSQSVIQQKEGKVVAHHLQILQLKSKLLMHIGAIPTIAMYIYIYV